MGIRPNRFVSGPRLGSRPAGTGESGAGRSGRHELADRFVGAVVAVLGAEEFIEGLDAGRPLLTQDLDLGLPPMVNGLGQAALLDARGLLPAIGGSVSGASEVVADRPLRNTQESRRLALRLAALLQDLDRHDLLPCERCQGVASERAWDVQDQLESPRLACRWMSSTTVVLNVCQARNDSGSLTPSFTGLVTMRQQDGRELRGVVSSVALGDARGADRPAAESGQSTCDQTKDVEMEEEASRASAPSALEENLSRDGGYDSLNGIGIKEGFEAGNGEAGLDHSEVRSGVGWHHHMTLSLVVLWFLCLERRRDGGENPGDHGVPDEADLHAVAPPPGAESRRNRRGNHARAAA